MPNGSDYVRWDTPVSDARSLAMVSLLDQDGLHITVQDLRDPDRRRYRFSFRKAPAYRNILEEYRTSEHVAGKDIGWTRMASCSAWLREFAEKEPFLDVFMPGCKHYVIGTEDDVIDVLSPEPPEICEIEPGSSEDAAIGKSTILYHSEDRDKIEKLLDEYKKPPSGEN